MGRWRFRIVYFVLLPAILVGAGALAYVTVLTARQYERLGERSIVESTLFFVQSRVEQLEATIIAADNAVFQMVDLADPRAVEQTWPAVAAEVSPTVRALAVLDDTGTPVAYAARANVEERRLFLKLLLERMLPDLALEQQAVGRLKHLHKRYGPMSYLLSYQVAEHEGRRFYLIAHHDTGRILRELVPALLQNESGKRLHNIVEADGRIVWGESLRRAGDFVVGRRFPTTLYEWRLQVAPKEAPLLGEKGRSRRVNEALLLGVALTVVLLGVAFIVYAADKERRLNDVKAEFLANVSHELKTPLSVIRMFGEMLLTHRVKSEEKRAQYLEIICRESERLSTLIENVLDFSALERGQRRYALGPADLADVTTRAIDTFRYRIEQEGTEVRLERIGVIPSLQLDEQAVLLAIVNLLDNAVKYGDGRSVSVTIERMGDDVHLRVRDHGAGIPERDLPHVFERFYRAHRRGHVRGSGIGLSLVKHIAEAHGGRAWARNAEGGGAEVGFTLPLAENRRAAVQSAEPTAPSTTDAASNPRNV